MKTRFFGSQIGSRSTVSHAYTASPSTLLAHDLATALRFAVFLPFIVLPLSPHRSGHLCELYPSARNLWAMFLHLVLLVLQLPFVLSVPLWVVFPVPLAWILCGVAVFWAVNAGICRVLNGSQVRVWSDERFAPRGRGHEGEQWVFLNGVAVGKHWMRSNLNRLALTFGRPVLGVHNKTNGILFDVIQCLIQRNFNYVTQDIRDCYVVVKETLYRKELTKVVFILHSQGGIEGGMIIDWLLQEVPQDLLAKLEVYTFGNAANHFNNPHSHFLSQHAALASPTTLATTRTTTQVHYHNSISNSPTPLENGKTMTTKSSRQSSSSGKAIRYIEHYAHTSDFVARWGVLHFVTSFTPDSEPTYPRYMGRVFERAGEGHQFNQHYLDNMFPLKPSSKKSGGIGGSGFEGCDEACEFMNYVVDVDRRDDECRDEREGLEISYLGAQGGEDEVTLRDMSPVSPELTRLALKTDFGYGRGMTGRKTEFKVKDLSRLWLYRNGASPKVDEVDIGIVRMSTI